MRKRRALALASNRSAARRFAQSPLRVECRVGSLESDGRAMRARVAVRAEFPAVGGEGYALVGSGIPLAVTPRGAAATQGARRLNEETA